MIFKRYIFRLPNLHSLCDVCKTSFSDSVSSIRRIPITEEESQRNSKSRCNSPPNAKVLKVAIIGAPNAGKSTLLNQLISWRVAAVSSKVHTTRHKTVGVLTENDTQIVFLDTPGLITHSIWKKHKMEKSLLYDPHVALCEADFIVSLVDISKVWNQSRLDREMLKILFIHKHKKSVLVLNKVDLVHEKKKLLQCIRLLTNEPVVEGKAGVMQDISRKQSELDSSDINSDIPVPNVGSSVGQDWALYEQLSQHANKVMRDEHGWAHFDRVFLISALQNDGVMDLRDYLITQAETGKWKYSADEVTSQRYNELAVMCVREHLLEFLPEEIPYVVDVKLVLWEVDENDLLHVRFDLICLRKRHFQYLLGRGGETVKLIAEKTKQSLMNTFRREMTLFLNVRM